MVKSNCCGQLVAHTTNQDLNYTCGHILPTIIFYHNDLLMYLILLFQYLITLANTTYKLPEDGARVPKHFGAIII